MLDIAILGLLMDRDHHGYEIRTQLRDRLGVWANVSFGSIYPALARLERYGYVEAVAPDHSSLELHFRRDHSRESVRRFAH